MVIHSNKSDKMMDKKTEDGAMMKKDDAIKEGEAMELKMKEEAAPAMPQEGTMMEEDGAMMMKH